jgi:ubiquinone/menaquinone biosynthesis C-methylase UbiE
VDISQKLPLANESVNLAFASNVLHGLVANGEADGTLKEVARAIMHNGRLVVVEFKKQESPMGPPLSIRLNPDDVEALAGGYSFSKESILEVGLHHYIIILRKI